jgi:hydroxymethylglutaryl-CoA reductase (NADPH)
MTWVDQEDVVSSDLASCSERVMDEEAYRGRKSGPPDREHPKVPARGHYTEESRKHRLQWAEAFTGKLLPHLGETSLDARKLVSNIENFAGTVEVPVGLAGPLWFNGENVQGYVIAPYAATEGALVASATRGAKTISLAGGVNTCTVQQVMLRVPCFVLETLTQAKKAARWLGENVAEMRELARRVSRHGELYDVEAVQLGRAVHARFLYRTGEAAGQNMTTAATWAVCKWVLERFREELQLDVRDFYIDANVSSDKKASMAAFIKGRGTSVIADCVIPGDVLKSVLDVTPRELARFHRHLQSGSVATGAIGHTGNVSNTVAAIFAATGQDMACTAESSLGQLFIEESEGDLYASLNLPTLIVATIGGGTGLPAQRDCLNLMGCTPAPGGAARLAEIIAGFALALDLSMLSAVTNGQFAAAHERLGRNRPIDWLTPDDLNLEFFRGLKLGEGLKSIERLEIPLGSSILTELSARRAQKAIGFFPFRLTYENNKKPPLDVVVKSKPTGSEVNLLVETMGKMCSGEVGQQVKHFIGNLGFGETHMREFGIYGLTHPAALGIFPDILFTHVDDNREIYLIGMERIDNHTLVDSEMQPQAWTREPVEAAIRGIAGFHAIHYGKTEALRGEPWVGHIMSADSMLAMTPLWEALVDHALSEFTFFTMEDAGRIRDCIRSIGQWWPVLDTMPKTLVHNDFNPRNICLRAGNGDGLQLCAYDWELATVHVPQRDVAELLAYVLRSPIDHAEVLHYVDFQRTCLEAAIGQSIEPGQWREGFVLALQDYLVNRLGLYMVAHTLKQYEFMPRIVRTALDILTTFRPAGDNPI